VPPPPLGDDEPNPLLAALKSDVNLIALGTAVGFAVLSGSFLPLLIAAGLELTCLPLLERYHRYMRARDIEKERAARKESEVTDMLHAMPEVERQHYRELQSVAAEIRRNYQTMTSTSQVLLSQLSDKLDVLLSSYLRMRYSLSRYGAYFRTTSAERIQERMAMLEHEMAKGAERVQQVKARTHAVLSKRLDRYQKAVENRELISAQTETIQEVLQLLRDQSYSMRDPRSIAEQVDGLISSAEETERGVKDLEEILSDEDESSLLGSFGDDIEAELEEGRTADDREAESRQAAAPPRGRMAHTSETSPPPPPPRKKITH
jgi:hypothetical protein